MIGEEFLRYQFKIHIYSYQKSEITANIKRGKLIFKLFELNPSIE
jgi:hypothetical protein